MKVIVDADMLIYASCFGKETLEECFAAFQDKINTVISDLTEFCEVSDVLVCNGSKNNFRKAVNKSYKANRTQEKPIFLNDLHNLVKKSILLIGLKVQKQMMLLLLYGMK